MPDDTILNGSAQVYIRLALRALAGDRLTGTAAQHIAVGQAQVRIEKRAVAWRLAEIQKRARPCSG